MKQKKHIETFYIRLKKLSKVSLILFLTTIISIIYFSWNINSWKFSFVGDEWPFYIFAQDIVQKNFLINPFDFQGVYAQNSVLTSYYQAVFLKLFGISNFSWRLSNIVLIIPITIFFFKWMTLMFDRKVALISTLILQSSFYLANFFKIGNIMPQALALFTLCLYLSARYERDQQPRIAFMLGIVIGISFYVYIGPLFPFIIWPYFVPLLKKPTKKLFLGLFLLSITYAFLLTPALVNLSSWSGPAGKTVFQKEYTDNFQIVKNIYHNYLLFYKNYDYLYNHFVAGPYLDLFSRFFASIGTVLVLFRIKQKKYLCLLLLYSSTCIVIGITSPYTYAATTRGLFFLPFGFAFAGIGLYAVYKIIPFKLFLACMLMIIFAINFYQSQIGVFKESGHPTTALILKTILATQREGKSKHVAFISSPDTHINNQNIPLLQNAYHVTDIQFTQFTYYELSCQNAADTVFVISHRDIITQKHISSLPCYNSIQRSLIIIRPTINL